VFRDRQVRSPEALDYGQRRHTADFLSLKKTAPTNKKEDLKAAHLPSNWQLDKEFQYKS
jgi:hypothetical protein